MKIFNEDSYTEEQFYLHYLKTLREKLIHIDQFLSMVKSLDPGPPKISECPIADRIERALAFRCFTCGSIFASKQASKYIQFITIIINRLASVVLETAK